MNITEEELRQIKLKSRLQGRQDIKDYIVFSLKNYHLKINIAGALAFIEELISFITGDSNIIHNTYGYRFEEFIKHI